MTDYQLLPPLSPEEYAELKADIAARGIQVPVEYDDTGNILDGFHRVKACEELGIKDWPRIIRIGLSEGEKRAHARKLNLLRRHLDRETRRRLIADQLRETPELSNNQIAGALQVSPHTVADVRNELAESMQIAHFLQRQDPRTGKLSQPVEHHASIMATGKQQAKQALAKIERQSERVQYRQAIAASAASVPPDARWSVEVGDIATYQTDKRFDFIITDPPYPREYLPLYGILAQRAREWLKPGGSLLVMSGQSYLPEVINLITPHLSYQWTLSYLTPGGQSPQIWPRKVNTFWKPVLWFVNGQYGNQWIGDVCKGNTNDNDKRFHDWGQSESGMLDLMQRFAKPGDSVFDPFCGGGTTGLVAFRLGCVFLGIDNDQAAVDVTRSRLSDA